MYNALKVGWVEALVGVAFHPEITQHSQSVEARETQPKLPLHLNHIFDSAQPIWLSGVVGAASPQGENQRRMYFKCRTAYASY